MHATSGHCSPMDNGHAGSRFKVRCPSNYPHDITSLRVLIPSRLSSTLTSWFTYSIHHWHAKAFAFYSYTSALFIMMSLFVDFKSDGTKSRKESKWSILLSIWFFTELLSWWVGRLDGEGKFYFMEIYGDVSSGLPQVNDDKLLLPYFGSYETGKSITYGQHQK